MGKSRVEKHMSLKISLDGLFSTVTAGATIAEDIEWDTEEEKKQKMEDLALEVRAEMISDLDTFLENNSLTDKSKVVLEEQFKKVSADVDADEKNEDKADSAWYDED